MQNLYNSIEKIVEDYKALTGHDISHMVRYQIAKNFSPVVWKNLGFERFETKNAVIWVIDDGKLIVTFTLSESRYSVDTHEV